MLFHTRYERFSCHAPLRYSITIVTRYADYCRHTFHAMIRQPYMTYADAINKTLRSLAGPDVCIVVTRLCYHAPVFADAAQAISLVIRLSSLLL